MLLQLPPALAGGESESMNVALAELLWLKQTGILSLDLAKADFDLTVKPPAKAGGK